MQIVHLVYVHGFQGNDTTFQSFPTDLHQYLSTQISDRLGLTLRTSLYPTYRSVKPISFATKNFLEWLSTQPPGPVILLGHSMGGLLAADAVTHASNNPDTYPGARPRRIMGMVAFDTPYLGMHPHVVVTGIASLLPKGDDEEKKKTEDDMNDTTKVNIVDSKVTDDWNAFKNDTNAGSRPSSIASPSPSPSPASPSLTPSPPSSSSLSPHPSSLHRRSPLPIVDRTMAFLSSHSNDPLVRWARKHADDPFSASKRWIVEHFQFGACMFDPSGLKDRYTSIVEWQGGKWVNYWTQTIPRDGSDIDALATVDVDNDAALTQTGFPGIDEAPILVPDEDPSPPPIYGPQTKSEAKADRQTKEKERKQAEKALKKEQKALSKKAKGSPGRHFIVLPTGLGQVLGGGDRWERVLIGGVEDEVAAHCGLFIRGQNLDYDGLVERVGTRILGWCESF
ncbi:hypothetical protein Hypma_001663 [Hypsizygus marmoreus]|uniref:DUF676 domain-containing protein n=1 Tax=Hypsizygus marmoreus TaxID=39966 RepID=A0A369JC69_HYPMA|nr:hypothetical protein Hypma_001663 [Hypsizygus marmoreus]